MSRDGGTDMGGDRLERRCRAVLRAYPRAFRAERGEELLATMLDANEGRRAPRLGDVLDVVRHGLARRAGRPAEPRAGSGWADAAAVALVAMLTLGVAAVAGLVVRFAAAVGDPYLPDYDVRVMRAAPVAAVVGVATLLAAYAGRRWLVRALLLAGLSAGAAVVLDALAAQRSGPRWHPLYLGVVGAGAVLLLVALLTTDAVGRAGRLVPRRVWAVAAVVSTAAAVCVALLDVGAGVALRTTELVLVSYAVGAGALLLLALPFWGREPRVTAGAGLAAAPAAPAVAVVVWAQLAVGGRAIPFLLPGAVAVSVGLVLLAHAALRTRRTGTS